MAKRGRRPSNVTRRKGFTVKQPGGPAAHKESVRRARERERILRRQAEAWRLHTELKLTFEQIGQRTGVSGKTAWEDVTNHAEGLRERGYLDSRLILVEQQAQIDGVKAKHYPRRGNPRNAEVLRWTLDHEAKLHGLYKPREAGYSVVQVLALLRGLLQDIIAVVTDEDARRQIAAIVRRRAALDIEAEPAMAMPSKPDNEEE